MPKITKDSPPEDIIMALWAGLVHRCDLRAPDEPTSRRSEGVESTSLNYDGKLIKLSAMIHGAMQRGLETYEEQSRIAITRPPSGSLANYRTRVRRRPVHDHRAESARKPTPATYVPNAELMMSHSFRQHERIPGAVDVGAECENQQGAHWLRGLRSPVMTTLRHERNYGDLENPMTTAINPGCTCGAANFGPGAAHMENCYISLAKEADAVQGVPGAAGGQQSGQPARAR